MKEGFFKFPSTSHLAVLSGVAVRDDKVMSESERDAFLQHDLIVEEKMDGANLGISFDSEGEIRAQNRGAYLCFPESGQWKKLEQWLSVRTEILFEHLVDRYVLFGEWCYAQHSVFYDCLPDWFLGFDLYDRQIGRFLSTERRDEVFRRMNIVQVPEIACGRFTFADLEKLFNTSQFGDQPGEGIYLRFDQKDWLGQRAKLVRPAFIQSVRQHWSRSSINPNRLS